MLPVIGVPDWNHGVLNPAKVTVVFAGAVGAVIRVEAEIYFPDS